MAQALAAVGVLATCPVCGARLETLRAGACPRCGTEHGLVDGIPLVFAPDRLRLYQESTGTAQEYWRGVASVYGRRHHTDLPGARRFLVEYGARLGPFLRPDQAALEIGAGTGFATALLSRKLPRLVATDASLEMLMLNRRRHPDVPMLCCPTEELPFPEAQFDVVLGNNTFYLVPDKAAAARSIARVLRPGGMLILSEINPFNPLWGVMFLMGRLTFERSIFDIDPIRMRSIFGAAGMRLEQVAAYSYAPYWAGPRIQLLGQLLEWTLGRSRVLRRFSAIRMWYVLRKGTPT